MNIETIDIKLFQLPVIIPFFVLSISTFGFILYVVFLRKIKTTVIFDISFILIIAGFITARILGIIDNWSNYSARDWGILPITDESGRIAINHDLPWELFNFLDGNLISWAIPIGVVIGAFLVYLISNKAQGIFPFMEKIIYAFIPAQIILLVGVFVSQFYFGRGSDFFPTFVDSVGDNRTNIAIIELVALLIALVLIIFTRLLVKKEGFSVVWYLLSISITGYFFVSDSEQINNSNVIKYASVAVGIFSFVLLFVIVRNILRKNIVIKKASDKKVEARLNKIELEEGVDPFQRSAYSDLEIRDKSIISSAGKVFRWPKRRK
jgi:hypothetical protein